MSTAKDAARRYTDPLTVRIHREIVRSGKSVRLVAALAGIEESTWRTSEAQAIAKALGVSFEWLIGLTEGVAA